MSDNKLNSIGFDDDDVLSLEEMRRIFDKYSGFGS